MNKQLWIVLFFLLTFISCENTENNRRLLEDAIHTIQTKPQDALKALQHIEHPESLPDSLKASYFLTLHKALLYTNTPITSDSLLDFPAAFYKQTSDTSQLLQVLILKSSINYQNYRTSQAIRSLKEALPLIDTISNTSSLAHVQVQLGYTFAQDKNYSQAREWLHKGIRTAQLLKDTSLQVAGWMNLSLVHLTEGHSLSGLDCLKQAEHLAHSAKKKEELNSIYLRLTDYCEKNTNYKQALNYNDSVRKYRDSRTDIPAINLKKALLLVKLNKQDSAETFAKKAFQSNDFLVADLACSLLSDLKRKQGQLQEAWKYRSQERDLYNAFDSEIQSAAMQQKYQKARLENENNQLRIRKNERDLWLICIVFAVFILASVSYIFFLQYRRKQAAQTLIIKQELIQSKANQLEKENLLLRQNQEISILREKEALMRESLFKRIRFFQKIPSLKPEKAPLQENPLPSSGKILLTSEDWSELLQNMNEIFPGFTGRLENEFPELDPDDLLFCCLVRINVNLQDLSDIYCLSKAAITKRKYRIKKEKFHVTDSTLSLDDFLRTI